jgi:hypothetical protein
MLFPGHKKRVFFSWKYGKITGKQVISADLSCRPILNHKIFHMKSKLILLGFLGASLNSFSQEGITEITKSEADQIENKVNKGVDFGVSLGFNTVFGKVYDARISPLDNKLKITSVSRSAFLLSTGLSVPISKGKLGGRYYRKLVNDEETGPVYFVPYGLCFIATVNLVTFNSAASGSAFNQKIDGGLGIGYRVNDNFQLTFTAEMISYRQPRRFLLEDYSNKILTTANGETVTAINPDDNNYFRDKYMPSISFKFFYLLSYKPVK